jgi:hypothetical protein
MFVHDSSARDLDHVLRMLAHCQAWAMVASHCADEQFVLIESDAIVGDHVDTFLNLIETLHWNNDLAIFSCADKTNVWKGGDISSRNIGFTSPEVPMSMYMLSPRGANDLLRRIESAGFGRSLFSLVVGALDVCV